jgi:hypothetical protein
MQGRGHSVGQPPSLQRIGEPVDRRSSSRYALRAPVIFHWHDGEFKHATGVSRDLSPVGAYVRCEHKTDCPRRGSTLTIEVLLPSVGDEVMKLKARGFVVRTNRGERPCGFAVRSAFGTHNGPERNRTTDNAKLSIAMRRQARRSDKKKRKSAV